MIFFDTFQNHRGGIRMAIHSFAVMVAVYSTYLVPAGVVAQPITLALQRTVEPAAYAPGEDLLVTLTITAEGSGTVTALGGEETLPAGWQFKESVAGPNGDPPIIPGKTPGKVEWAFINIPEFPIQFSYRVTVSASSRGTQQISGYLRYRLTGGEILSPEVTTEIPQQSGPVMTAEQLRELLRNALGQADTDGDGQISFAEASAFSSGISQELFSQLDLDGDGFLSPLELGAAIQRGCGCLANLLDKSPGATARPWSDLLVLLSGLLGLAAAAVKR